MPELSFLPALNWDGGLPDDPERRLPFEFAEALWDPNGGGCVPLPGLDEVKKTPLGTGRGVLINPKMSQAARVIEHAFRQAMLDEAVLLIHYLGHGASRQRSGEAAKHYLQARDSAEVPTNRKNGWDIYSEIEYLLEDTNAVGLVLTIDACYASNATTQIGGWANREGIGPHLWMGASQNAQAFDACFTKTILNLIRTGVPEDDSGFAAQLRALQLEGRINNACEHQKVASSQNPAGADQLYIATNRAFQNRINELGLDQAIATLIQERRSLYQPNQAEDIVDWMAGLDPPIGVLVGGPGTGKSTVAAVLRDPPEVLNRIGFDAVEFLGQESTPDLIAPVLWSQLVTNRQYAQAHSLARSQPGIDPTKLAPSDEYLMLPLSFFPGTVRIVLDGFDQLSPNLQEIMRSFLVKLTSTHPRKVRVLVTSRHEIVGLESFPIPGLDDVTARAYLASRDVDEAQRDALVTLADGSWVILNLAANFARTHGRADLTSPDGLFEDIYEGAAQRHGREAVSAVIAVLSATAQAAGPGARLPYTLFADAARRLGAPATKPDVYALISDQDLYGMIERTNPGTEGEHLGWFHTTLADGFSALGNIKEGHLAIADAIEALADTPKRHPPDSDEA